MEDLIKQRISERLERVLREQGLQRNELAQVANVSNQSVTNWINRGQISTKSARLIAERYGYPIDWILGGEDDITLFPVTSLATNEQGKDDDEIVIDVLDVEASAGFGSYAGELIEVVSQVRYKTERYYELFKGMNPENVYIINVKGDSMLPTFAPGDLIFVDITVNSFDGDGIYIFTFDKVTYVKRLQKMGRKLRVISDNRECYDPWDIEGEDLEYVYIHGRVKVHQSQKLNWVG